MQANIRRGMKGKSAMLISISRLAQPDQKNAKAYGPILGFQKASFETAIIRTG
jgi:hypothetical protein